MHTDKNMADKNSYQIKKYGIFNKIKHHLNRNKIGEILVTKGIITPYQLKNILKLQKETQKPLGQILQDLNLITRGQLTRILWKQKAIRFAAAFMLYSMSLGGFMKSSHAGEIKDIPAKVTLASASSTSFKPMHRYPALFGADEKQSSNLKAFTKWIDMFDRFDKEMQNSANVKIIEGVKKEISKYKSSSIYDMAKNVNAMMNKQRYIIDNKNWGQSDYWATPVEFMKNGGDCEDFAIAKYVALRALGVPEARMRIAIVQDQIKNMPHAILIVYSEQGAVILDNQIKEVRRAKTINHYKPIFSINRTAWWLHTTPNASPEKASSTIVASAK